jgi:BirA family biotin operon repressor/biotin-[acetyl-CoA-carboxylase] ligase
MRVIRFDSVDSTSTEARRVIERGGDGAFVVVAKTQTAGRGRFARSWASPVGGLWCTIAWPARGVALDGLGLRIGLACARTIEGALRRAGSGDDARLKWPNDVYVGGRKILGVLTEAVAVGGARFLLTGVGINANFGVEELPPEVAGTATTLRERTGADSDLGSLLDDLVGNLERAIRAPGVDSAMLAEARFRLHGVGKEAEVRVSDGQSVRGVLVGLDDAGRPLVRTATGDYVGVAMEAGW